MQVRGTVVSVEFDVAVAKNGGGSYHGTRFAYRDENGALKERGIHNNVFKYNAPLKVQFSNLNTNDKFVMEMEKENDFWNIKSISKDTETIVPAQTTVAGKPAATPSPKSTYETPEERAKKQLYIVRQSSITQAITLLNSKKATSVEEVLQVAKQFEAHVFGQDFDDGMPISMRDDTDGIV